MNCDTDTPHRSIPSVTTNMQHAMACTTQALSPRLEGPDTSSFHVMLPTPASGMASKLRLALLPPSLGYNKQQSTVKIHQTFCHSLAKRILIMKHSLNMAEWLIIGNSFQSSHQITGTGCCSRTSAPSCCHLLLPLMAAGGNMMAMGNPGSIPQKI